MHLIAQCSSHVYALSCTNGRGYYFWILSDSQSVVIDLEGITAFALFINVGPASPNQRWMLGWILHVSLNKFL